MISKTLPGFLRSHRRQDHINIRYAMSSCAAEDPTIVFVLIVTKRITNCCVCAECLKLIRCSNVASDLSVGSHTDLDNTKSYRAATLRASAVTGKRCFNDCIRKKHNLTNLWWVTAVCLLVPGRLASSFGPCSWPLRRHVDIVTR